MGILFLPSYAALTIGVKLYDIALIFSLSLFCQVCVNRLLTDWGCGPIVKDDFIHEMCRYGASEVHSVAAYIGGCAAQEVIKIITAQYVPINNTHIYNAIAATSGTFML